MSHDQPLALGARLSKLRVMSASEVCGRLRYQGVVAIERRLHRVGRLEHPERLQRALNPEVGSVAQLIASRLVTPPRFFAGAADQPAMRRLFEDAFAPERRDTLARAADARGHRFSFFGRTFEFGETIAWQSDPVTGRPWPSCYHADVGIAARDNGCDIKYVWELSRQQCVLDLAKSWFLTNNREDLTALRGIVRSWIAGNPYATGVNWSCALEPAYRVFSWLWAYHLTRRDLDDGFHVEWLTALFDHGRFIERHLELHSSPFNHLIAEAAALYMLGVCLPELRVAARWRARGRHVLESRLAEQFYADGGSVEQSMYYHHATLGSYLMAALLARTTGDDFPSAIWAAIERAIDFSMRLCQPDGTTPAIGGADDGRPLRMECGPLWDFRSYQAVGAVVFSRPDFKALAGRFREDALWLLGPAALAQFEALESRLPADRSSALGASGYFVMRSEWSPRADYVCVDCGEQAAGLRTDAIPNAMHGHADCLSIIAWLGGRRVLVDSGLYAYNCGGEWESHFRETAAHNTGRVDGRDQARHLGKMAWSHSYRAFLEGWQGDEGWVLGRHDGFARGPHGILHRRAVWLRPDSCLIVYDEFVGQGPHEFEVNYQFAPGTFDLTSPGAVLFDGAVDIGWVGRGAWQVNLAHGGSSPQDGWIAPSLGVRQAAPRLTLSCEASQPPVSLLTVVAARTTPAPRVLRVLATIAGESPLLAVAGRGFVDWIVAGPTRVAAPITTDATVGICRVSGETCVETHHLGGTHVDVDTRALASLQPDGWRAIGTAR
jgi:hypothetical protein